VLGLNAAGHAQQRTIVKELIWLTEPRSLPREGHCAVVPAEATIRTPIETRLDRLVRCRGETFDEKRWASQADRETIDEAKHSADSKGAVHREAGSR
jgi:hypothetical protein